MQFTIPFLAVVGFAAAQSSTTNDASGTTSSLSPTQTCLNACAEGDVNCQAQCVGVPFPNGAQINATTDCSMNCDQGDGSPSATEQYGKCLANCAASYYYTSSGTVPTAGFTGAAGAAGSTAGSASASATDGAAMASGSAASGASGASMSATGAMSSGSEAATSATGAAASSGSSTSASASSSSSAAAAAGLHVELGSVGILGLLMAVFAL